MPSAAYKAAKVPEQKLNKQRGRVEKLEKESREANQSARDLENNVQTLEDKGESQSTIGDAIQEARKAAINTAMLLKEFTEAMNTFKSRSDTVKASKSRSKGKAPLTPTTGSSTKGDIPFSTPAKLQIPATKTEPKPSVFTFAQRSMEFDSSYEAVNSMEYIAATALRDAPSPAAVQSPGAVSGVNKPGDNGDLGERPQKRRKIQEE